MAIIISINVKPAELLCMRYTFIMAIRNYLPEGGTSCFFQDNINIFIINTGNTQKRIKYQRHFIFFIGQMYYRWRASVFLTEFYWNHAIVLLLAGFSYDI